MAVRVKGSARKQVVQAAFCFSGDLQSTAANLSCLSNRQNSQNLLQPAPSPVGEGWGEGILRISAIFPNTLTVQMQALRLVALSLTLSHGREDGVAVRVKGSARKQVVQAAFCFSGDLQSTAANLSCLSNRQNSQNLLQPAPSPVGEGWGEGILRISATFPNNSTTEIQALRLVALSLTLSHRERGRGGCSG